MVLKYSQQDEGEITLTGHEVYLHQTHVLTEVKVEKESDYVVPTLGRFRQNGISDFSPNLIDFKCNSIG